MSKHPRSDRITMPLRPLALAAVLTAVLTGCGVTAPQPGPIGVVASDPLAPLASLEVLDDPRDYIGPSTAVLADRPFPRLEGVPGQQLPATVTSRDLGGDVTQVVERTDRILPMDLAGSIAATVFGLGLGDRVVGRDISTTFQEAADLPIVTTGGHSINAEAVIALRPDVVITDGTIGPIDVVLQLRDAGIPVVFVDTQPTIQGVGDLARQVAHALGADAAGDELAARLLADVEAKIDEIAAILPSGDPLRMVFLYLRGASGIYYLFGAESGAGVLIESIGGIDIATELGYEGMRPMTDEALVAADPEVILVMTEGLESAGGVAGLLEAKPAVALTAAGQHERFVDMADGQVLGFGPRTADVLDALARAVYAPGQ